MRDLVLGSLSFFVFLSLFTALSNYDTITRITRRNTSAVASKTSVEERFTNVLSRLDRHHKNETLQPISCRALLRQIKHNQSDVDDPNGGYMHARQTITDPRFWISLHKQEFDGPRWGIMEHGHYYERVLMDSFAQVLRQAPDQARVVDVGGNIGFFSLLSASVRPVAVDAFEPNLKNVLRFCESLGLNRWYSEYEVAEPTLDSYVNIYPYGVGKKVGNVPFRENDNPGMGSFLNGGQANRHEAKLRVVTLDEVARQKGWFSSRPHIAILKVDVEGYELNVFEGAKEFLKTQLVRNIFMEVSGRNAQEQLHAIALVKTIQGLGYRLYKYGSWSGPGTLCDWKQDASLPFATLNYTLITSAKQANLWWKRAKD